MVRQHVPCAHCRHPSRLTDGREIYPNRRDLRELKFWRCDRCDAHVGCHKPDVGHGDGTVAYGYPANKELRRARNWLHNKFDPIWMAAPRNKRRTTRRRLYRILSRGLQISTTESHIGMFNLPQCRKCWVLLDNVTWEHAFEQGRYDPSLDRNETLVVREEGTD